MYVDQQFKEHVAPLKVTLEEKIVKLEEVTEHANKLEDEMKTVDKRYDDACRAILKTNGILVVDLDSHSIFMAYK